MYIDWQYDINCNKSLFSSMLCASYRYRYRFPILRVLIGFRLFEGAENWYLNTNVKSGIGKGGRIGRGGWFGKGPRRGG